MTGESPLRGAGRFSMKNIRKVFGLIALAALIALSITACGGNDSSSPKHIHTWGPWGVTTPATCSAEGVETRVCADDTRHKDTRPIAKNPDGHVLESGSTPPTCTTDGNTGFGYCTLCGDYIYGITIPALGHLGLTTAAVPATCTTQGKTEGGLCTRPKAEGGCGEDVPVYTTSKLGHYWDWPAYTTGSGLRNCQRSGCTVKAGVGDTGPAGGKIFYAPSGGFEVKASPSGTPSVNAWSLYKAYYLEAAPGNQSTGAQWGANGTLITEDISTFTSQIDTYATIFGYGRRDTQKIVNTLGTSETGRAAQLCANKSLYGFTDWFLPSLRELRELYSVLGKTEMLTEATFWSSSQCDSIRAWTVWFGNSYGGRVEDAFKDFTIFYVRAVRAF